jgi:nucleoside 2-deoxyribosyltransferase
MKHGRDFLVYLAGPISGMTYDEAQAWRAYASQNLPQEIRAISPLRAKSQRLARLGKIWNSYEDHPLCCESGITARDRNDCTRADALIVNLLGATFVSPGTCIELGWADVYRIPVILVMEKTGNPYDHPMVRRTAGFRVETLDEALAVCEAVLMPEGVGPARELPLEPIQDWRVPVLDPGQRIAA